MFWILSLIFVLLNIWDIILTKKALRLGAKEFNPIAQKFGLYIPKLIFALPCVLIAYFVSYWILIIGMIIMFAGIVHNLSEYKKLGG